MSMLVVALGPARGAKALAADGNLKPTEATGAWALFWPGNPGTAAGPDISGKRIGEPWLLQWR